MNEIATQIEGKWREINLALVAEFGTECRRDVVHGDPARALDHSNRISKIQENLTDQKMNLLVVNF